MIGLKRHPSWGELNRLVDGELDSPSRGVVLEHLAGCSRCTRELAFLEQVRAVGSDLPHPSPPKGLLEDVLRHRAEGQRVILPAAPPAPPRRRRILPAAAAAVIMAGMGMLATSLMVPEAGAGASDLQFDPPNPVPGETVRITYRPNTELAGEPELRVRMRIREADSPPPRFTLGEYAETRLRATGDGVFEGEYRLPPDFALTMAAVESLDRRGQDDNGGWLWSLRAHTDAGAPRLSALRQEFRVLEKRRWADAHEVLRDMAHLYPNQPEGWSLLLTYAQPVQLPEERAASQAAARELLRTLQAHGDSAGYSIEGLAALARIAATLEDWEARDIWIERLREVHPHHRLVITADVMSYGDDRAGAEAYLDRLWVQEGFQVQEVARNGLALALQLGDASLAARWAARGLPVETDPRAVETAALSLTAYDETRGSGAATIDSILTALSATEDRNRPLHQRPEEFKVAIVKLSAGLRVELARQLLSAGSPEAALREANLADSLGLWLPDVYRVRLEAHLAMGDTAAAVADFDRLNADPVTEPDTLARIRSRLPVRSAAQLASGVRIAEVEMDSRVLAHSLSYPRLPSVNLLGPTGRETSLRSLILGRPTVLMIWDRRPAVPEDLVPEVRRAAALAESWGGQVLWITSEPDSYALQSFLREVDLAVTPHFDVRSELARQLGHWGTQHFYAVDRAGVVRLRTDSLMEAVRHLEVLLRGSRDTA